MFSFARRVAEAVSSPHDRPILDLAVPALAGLAADPLVSLVDTAYVGQVGTIELAALGINASVFSMTFLIFNFLAHGTTPRVGQALGSGNRREASRVVMRALLLAVLAGAIALTLLQLLAVPILHVMGASGDIFGPALDYLRIRALAGPAVLIITASHGAFRGYQDTVTPMTVTIAFNVVNAVLDPILIFVLDFGLAGAAMATVTAQWAGAMFFLWLLFSGMRDELKITPEMPALRSLGPFLSIGRDLFIRTASLVGTMTLATATAARFGATATAAHQVAAQLWLFLALLVDALAVAGQALVSKHLGAGKQDTARTVSNRLLQWGLGVGIVLGVVFYGLQPFLPPFFSDETATIAAVLSIFPFVAFLQPLNGLVFVWDGLYMGAEAFSYLARAMILSAGAASAVILLSVPFDWGLPGIWWGITTLMIVRLFTLAIPYARGNMLEMGG